MALKLICVFNEQNNEFCLHYSTGNTKRWYMGAWAKASHRTLNSAWLLIQNHVTLEKNKMHQRRTRKPLKASGWRKWGTRGLTKVEVRPSGFLRYTNLKVLWTISWFAPDLTVSTLVYRTMARSLLGIWTYYKAKLERHFAIVLYTNISASSRECNPRIGDSY